MVKYRNDAGYICYLVFRYAGPVMQNTVPTEFNAYFSPSISEIKSLSLILTEVVEVKPLIS